MILLSVVFIKCIPNMLNAGKNSGTAKNAFSAVLKLRFGKEKIGFLFVLNPRTANTTNAMLNEIKRGFIANGVSYPRLSDRSFINNPKSIKKEMLNPTDSTNFSVNPNLFNLSTWRINNPGKMVRKRNPSICLKNGVFRSIARSAMRSIEIVSTKYPLVPDSLLSRTLCIAVIV